MGVVLPAYVRSYAEKVKVTMTNTFRRMIEFDECASRKIMTKNASIGADGSYHEKVAWSDGTVSDERSFPFDVRIWYVLRKLGLL